MRFLARDILTRDIQAVVEFKRVTDEVSAMVLGSGMVTAGADLADSLPLESIEAYRSQNDGVCHEGTSGKHFPCSVCRDAWAETQA
jgi:hypothetical protein